MEDIKAEMKKMDSRFDVLVTPVYRTIYKSRSLIRAPVLCWVK